MFYCGISFTIVLLLNHVTLSSFTCRIYSDISPNSGKCKILISYCRGFLVECTPTSSSVLTNHSDPKTCSYSLTYKSIVSFPKHKCVLSLVAHLAKDLYLCSIWLETGCVSTCNIPNAMTLLSEKEYPETIYAVTWHLSNSQYYLLRNNGGIWMCNLLSQSVITFVSKYCDNICLKLCTKIQWLVTAA